MRRSARIASLCKAVLPEKFKAALMLAGEDEAAQFEVGVDFAIRQVQGLIDAGVPGVHFYVLNKSQATERVLQEVRMTNNDVVSDEERMSERQTARDSAASDMSSLGLVSTYRASAFVISLARRTLRGVPWACGFPQATCRR